ncbi:hypothetical protein [Shinella sp. BYT-45]|uniref:hypothetical protein n=1 Tax=Shinella sp. BYT-45 TaxID=3377377 RepID=UPI0039808D67
MNDRNPAITQIIKAMQRDAEDLMNQIDLAAGDIGEGRRNGAIGALAPVDATLERLSSLLAAARAIHRMTPL